MHKEKIMKFDFEKSLTYITNDAQWVSKLLIGALLVFGCFAIFFIPVLLMLIFHSAIATVCALVVCFIASIVLLLAISGYFCITSNLRINDDNALLPEWKDFGKFIVAGLKYFVGYFIYVLPLFFFGSIFMFLLVFSTTSSNSSAFSSVISFLIITLIGAAVLFLYVLTMLFMPLMLANFNKNLKILSFVDLKDAFTMLKDNVGNYAVLILLFIAVSLLGQVVCSILCLTVIGIILLPVVYFYIYFVLADVIAQFVNSKS